MNKTLRQPVAAWAHDPVADAVKQIQRGVEELESAVAAQVPTATAAVSAISVRAVIAARRARSDLILSDVFFDPAWDILLELYARALEQRRIHISELVKAIGISMTTGLRWLDRLGKEGMVVRRTDTRDARRVWVELSSAGITAMGKFFRTIRSVDVGAVLPT